MYYFSGLHSIFTRLSHILEKDSCPEKRLFCIFYHFQFLILLVYNDYGSPDLVFVFHNILNIQTLKYRRKCIIAWQKIHYFVTIKSHFFISLLQVWPTIFVTIIQRKLLYILTSSFCVICTLYVPFLIPAWHTFVFFLHNKLIITSHTEVVSL